VPMFDVDQFITECRSALAERQAPTAVKEVVERALSRPHEIDAALGVPERGGISTLETVMLPSATRSRRSALNCTLRLSREAQTPSRLLSRLRRGSRSLCNPTPPRRFRHPHG
jgi:hypothetical protein